MAEPDKNHRRRDVTVTDEAAHKGLGIAVHRVRGDKAMSVVELADRAGLTITTITAIELGRQDTAWGNLRRLARGLEVELDELLDLAIDLAPGPGGDELRRDRATAARRFDEDASRRVEAANGSAGAERKPACWIVVLLTGSG